MGTESNAQSNSKQHNHDESSRTAYLLCVFECVNIWHITLHDIDININMYICIALHDTSLHIMFLQSFATSSGIVQGEATPTTESDWSPRASEQISVLHRIK